MQVQTKIMDLPSSKFTELTKRPKEEQTKQFCKTIVEALMEAYKASREKEQSALKAHKTQFQEFMEEFPDFI